ncbi:MAG TPA: paraquat-inducible protein A [Thermoanaerobaculia bacterium]|jgi:paraquat-inducible protein A|nr:paraquat-inducible protein A [Thermoanaerobaculia bacterium]
MTITCADCGRTQTIPPLPPGSDAECQRCDRLLSHRSKIGLGVDLPLACAIAIFVLLPPAVFMPLMDSTIKNLVFQESRLVSSVPVIYGEVWFPFAFGFLFFAFLFPAVRAGLQIIVLGSIRTGKIVPHAGRFFRWSEELRIWSMTEVVVIAGIIAYYRAAISASVILRLGAWCYLAVAIFAFIADRALDRRAVWNSILRDHTSAPVRHFASCGICEMAVSTRRPGDPCPRCGHTLDSDAAKRYIPAVTAVAAAIPLLLPAYSFSFIVNDRITGMWEHTVVGTVQLLADYGYWQFGVILLIAGVLVPFLELAGMIWLLVTVRFPTRRGLVLRTRVYRVLHRLVRWPMIIPFVAAMAAPIVEFKGIDEIVAGTGATPLFLFIALTMLAVRLFEPKLMWRTAGGAW